MSSDVAARFLTLATKCHAGMQTKNRMRVGNARTARLELAVKYPDTERDGAGLEDQGFLEKFLKDRERMRTFVVRYGKRYTRVCCLTDIRNTNDW